MAYYHLEIKSDKRPDGTKIAAALKSEYIDREGQYKDLDEKRMAAHNIFQNAITSEVSIERAIEKDMLLYESPFGSIIRAQDGSIKTSNEASIETIAIALALAEKIYGEPISLHGDQRFQAQVLVAANEMDLPIHFADALLEKQYTKMQEVRSYERGQRTTYFGAGSSAANGRGNERNRTDGRGNRKSGRDSDGERNRSGGNGSAAPVRSRTGNSARSRSFGGRSRNRSLAIALRINNAEHGDAEVSEITSQRPFSSVSSLSQRSVAPSTEGSEMLVYGHEHNDVSDYTASIRDRVRWDTAGARRGRVRKTADDIMVTLQQNLDSVFASSHIQYINREAAFQQRGGCIYKGHHLPTWAKDNPKTFFTEADKWERSNGERYKELILALPNELTLNQQKEIIDDFIDQHLKNFYYSYAIHDKVGVMSNGEHHTHVHLMFSTREMDDYEKRVGRNSAKHFFKRADAAVPSRGGCKKSTTWTDKHRQKYLCKVRESFAKIQNDILRKYEIPLEVDHRSLAEQKTAAIANGHTVLASLLDRIPETRLSPNEVLAETDDVRNIRRYRLLRQEFSKKVYAADLLKREIGEEEMRIALLDAKKELASLRALPGYDDLDEDPLEDMSASKLAIHNFLTELEDLQGATIWNHDALVKAWESFMTMEEKEDWQAFRSITQERRNLLAFKDSLKEPAKYNTEDWNTYQNILGEIKRATEELDRKIAEAAQKVRPVFDRLNTPLLKKRINKVRENFLFENDPTKNKVAEVTKNLRAEIARLQFYLQNQNDENYERATTQRFSAKDILQHVMEKYREVKKEYAEAMEAAEKAKSKILSMDRAAYMARTQFLNHEDVAVRKGFTELKKRKKYLSNDQAAWKKKETDFLQIPKPGILASREERERYKAMQQNLLREKEQLEQKQQEILATQKSLFEKDAQLKERCSSPEAKAKMEEITLGILRKNQPYVAAHGKAMEHLQDCAKQLNKVRIELAAVRKHVHKDGPKIFYQLKSLQADTARGKAASGEFAVPSNEPPANEAQGAQRSENFSGGGHAPSSSPPSLIAAAMSGDDNAARLVMRTANDDSCKNWDLMSDLEKEEILHSIENLDRY